MPQYRVYVAGAVIAVALRWMLALSEGCLFVGKAISDIESKAGFRDAVAPLVLTKYMVATWGELCF